MDNVELKNAIKLLLQEMLQDEADLKSQHSDDMYAKGQLSATQYNRIKIESLLESSGSNRPSTIDI